MMSLHWPWLLLLLPLPWFVWHFMPSTNKQEAALFFPALATVRRARGTGSLVTSSQRSGSAMLWFLWVTWLLLIVAVARPQWQGEPQGQPTSGRDLLLAVDLSGSMETPDMQVNGKPAQRIDAIKKVVADFVRQRTGDRLGLVLFGDKAYLQTPLTFDRATLAQQLNEAQIGFAGEKTAIGDAIALAVKRLQDRPQKSRVIILLTDGANNSGSISPLQGAELAASLGIKIYTVGVGADEMTVPSFFGSQTVNPSADLDEGTLTQIAKKTGGQYFRARNTEELRQIYQELDKLEPSASGQAMLRPIAELFYWPLSLALLLSFAMALARVRPTQAQYSIKKGEQL